jgi:Fe2+ or Zn2+ uptake regulation protein
MSHRCRYNSALSQFAARNVPITPRRKAVIQAFEGEEGRRLDAASLLGRARAVDSTIDRAAVYRTIALRKRLRLIDELSLMHLSGDKPHRTPVLH